MTNKEIRNTILSTIAASTISRDTDTIKHKLIELVRRNQFSIPQRTLDKLRELTIDFNWSQLDYQGYYNPQQIDRFLIAACYVIKCFYYNAVTYSRGDRKDGIQNDEIINDLLEELVPDFGLSYFPINHTFNSIRNSDAPGNVIRFLELNNVIVKRKNSFKFPNGYGRCAKYELLPKFFEIYCGERGDIKLDLPQTYTTVLEKKIQRIAEFEQELYMMAWSFFLKPSEKDMKIASNRVQRQKEIRGKLFNNEEEHERAIRILDKECGMTMSTAVVVSKIYNQDASIVMMCSNDKYAGRFYHAWTSLPSEIRERAEIRGELGQFFKNKRLVEVDLSQSCMYFILIEYLKYCNRVGIKPTKHLVKAVYAGKLREYICLNATGKFTEKVNGEKEKYHIDFDEIRTIRDYNKNKDKLKKFCMKGLNCSLNSEAARIFDRALSTIDKNFKEWLITERKGWWNDFSTKSTVPFKTLVNEVEFMLGIKAWHILPTDKSKMTTTPVVYNKSQFKSVTELLLEKGCKFFLTVHDAIITTEEDLGLVYESLKEAAELRGHLFAPCAKTTFFKTGKVKKNCYSREEEIKILQDKIAGRTEKPVKKASYNRNYRKPISNSCYNKVSVPLKRYLDTFPTQDIYYTENIDKYYYKDILRVRKAITKVINRIA